eukprot:TRINITY_DN31155_c0_g1_i2.p1 TRINITY_DN31155_c0_g1~~TRINITY_DN31155_c0_g1_i2.p1  ORF type:complete len:348 (+),score=81.22 TRINITY_DN31155_c0_g1_i2:127-1170(+)
MEYALPPWEGIDGLFDDDAAAAGARSRRAAARSELPDHMGFKRGQPERCLRMEAVRRNRERRLEDDFTTARNAADRRRLPPLQSPRAAAGIHTAAASSSMHGKDRQHLPPSPREAARQKNSEALTARWLGSQTSASGARLAPPTGRLLTSQTDAKVSRGGVPIPSLPFAPAATRFNRAELFRRQRERQERRKENCVELVQSVCRVHLARQLLLGMARQQQDAVDVIQRSYRRHRLAAEIDARSRRREECHLAATRIQAFRRGQQCRKNLRARDAGLGGPLLAVDDDAMAADAGMLSMIPSKEDDIITSIARRVVQVALAGTDSFGHSTPDVILLLDDEAGEYSDADL